MIFCWIGAYYFDFWIKTIHTYRLIISKPNLLCLPIIGVYATLPGYKIQVFYISWLILIAFDKTIGLGIFRPHFRHIFFATLVNNPYFALSDLIAHSYPTDSSHFPSTDLTFAEMGVLF